MKLIFPAGQQSYLDASGNRYVPDANGMLDIGSADPIPFIHAGFVAWHTDAVPTSGRPTTGLSPGRMLYDLTLGKPIWRNSANTGWCDATGASV